jgi:hypothetical protein
MQPDEMSMTMGTQGVKMVDHTKAGNEDAMELDGDDDKGSKNKKKAELTKAAITKILPPESS